MRLTGHLAVIAVGKLRRTAWREAQQDYVARLQRYTHLQLIELKDVVGHGVPDAVGKQRESQALLDAAADFPFTVALSAEGREMDSLQFADFIRRKIELYGRLAFLVGGPLGFEPRVADQCAFTLALSKMTFPHEIARLLLLEQLYRAATILSGEKYHK